MPRPIFNFTALLTDFNQFDYHPLTGQERKRAKANIDIVIPFQGTLFINKKWENVGTPSIHYGNPMFVREKIWKWDFF